MSEQAVTITIEETNQPVEAGETLEVAVVVENEGEDGSDEIELLDFSDDVVDSDELELGAGEQTERTLEWTPGSADVGSGDVTVSSTGGIETVSVTVEDKPATFEVDVTAIEEYVPTGGIVHVVATIENTGTLEGTQEIEISVREAVELKREITLAGGENEDIEYEIETSADDAPDVTVSVSSDDDSESESIPVVTVSVSPVSKVTSKSGMGVFGWLMFLGMIILFIPLLPLYIALKLYELLFRRNQPVR